ncbi:MAG: hypothetical protein IJY66_06195 [Clostridia bacterium]|nr:hypothetical protein [Clostridia bacterium]
MKTTDMLGHDLPLCVVCGVSLLPPPLFAVREHLPHLSGFVRNVIIGEFETVDISAVTAHFQKLGKYSPTPKKARQRLARLNMSDLLEACADYVLFLREELPQLPYCAVPNVTDEEAEHYYEYPQFLSSEKLVADYANISVPQALRLNLVDFLILQREACIHNLSQSKKGRDLLEAAFCAEQTEPDRTALRAQFGGDQRGK